MWVVTKLDKSNFKDLIKEWVTVVDFWAEWCWPCKIMLPILEEFAKEMWDSVNVWKVNVDENQELSSEYRIMSIPAIFVFKDWEIVEQLVWVQQVNDLKEICKKYL